MGILTYWLSTIYKKEAQGENPRPVTNHKKRIDYASKLDSLTAFDRRPRVMS